MGRRSSSAHVGDDEVLLDDSLRFAERAQDAGVDVPHGSFDLQGCRSRAGRHCKLHPPTTGCATKGGGLERPHCETPAASLGTKAQRRKHPR